MYIRPIIGCLLAALPVLSACSLINEEGGACEDVSRAVPVNLFMGIGSGVQRTKADASVITEMDKSFRGMTDVRILPFSTGNGVKVASGDVAKGIVHNLPDILGGSFDSEVFDGIHFHSGLLATSQAHLYSSSVATMPVGTTAALIYGIGIPAYAASEKQSKSLNGSLLEEGWEVQETNHRAGDIFFSPDPIYDDDVADAAWEVADILTEVSSVTFTQEYVYYSTDHYEQASICVHWDTDLSDAILKKAFDDFVADGTLIPGDGRLLANRLNVLRAVLESYNSTDDTHLLHTPGNQEALYEEGGEPVKWGDLYNGLKIELLSKINLQEINSFLNFPVSEGLPAGSALFRWNGARFIPVPEDTGALLAAVDYCYMPPLYYFANTTVRTSTNSHIYEKFPEKTWDQIIPLYTGGYIVTYKSRSVAMESPLQFACGMLNITVKSASMSLQDNEDYTVVLSNGTEFPLTGFILGGQFRQRFDFSPVTDSDVNAMYKEFFLYDSHISGISLRTETSDVFRTLSLPTPKERDVYFALEFCNNSGTAFYGADGLVPVGCTFYLMGKLDPPPAETQFERAMISDHATNLNCTVASLANARLTVPRMGTPELVVGVQTQTNWDFTPASYVVLE